MKSLSEEDIREACLKSGLPEYMHDGVVLYLKHGIMTGSFLTAVFSNDLTGAFGAADSDNRASLYNWASFLYNECPATAYGSPAIVAEWKRQRRASTEATQQETAQ